MNARPPPPLPPEAVRFRRRLLIAMGVIVGATTVAALLVVRRNVAADEERLLEREFEGRLALLHSVQQTRHAALVERCRKLARRPRLHAALEDDAFDLLYVSAADELRDMVAAPGGPAEPAGRSLRAHFYRFLDRHGRVITTTEASAGGLSWPEESQLARPELPAQPVPGYLVRRLADGSERIAELITTPVVSGETGEAIAALVLGFDPVEPDPAQFGKGFFGGIWHGGRLFATAADPGLPPAILRQIAAGLRERDGSAEHFTVADGGGQWLVFRRNLPAVAPGTAEVCAFPLAEMSARQRRLGWQVAGAGIGLLVGGLGISYLLSLRLAEPVGRLAIDSQRQREQRARAEAELEARTADLQRAARFSANASHQLKTPVTVMRAGLEELQRRRHLTPDDRAEISALIHQTYRLSSVIEDLLLLSRMDAGQLRLAVAPVDLSELVAAALDDLSALDPDAALAVEEDVPAGLTIRGEKRYTAVILQNLFENARKYNRPGGRIRVTARAEGGCVLLAVGNTTRGPIPADVREHIFERFHRGGVGENIPGYGLGLNLARELARLHDGDLRLVGSADDWAEFEVSFRTAPAGEAPA